MDLENGSSGLYFYEMPGLPEMVEEEDSGTKKTRVKFSTSPIVVCHLGNFTHDIFLFCSVEWTRWVLVSQL